MVVMVPSWPSAVATLAAFLWIPSSPFVQSFVPESLYGVGDHSDNAGRSRQFSRQQPHDLPWFHHSSWIMMPSSRRSDAAGNGNSRKRRMAPTDEPTSSLPPSTTPRRRRKNKYATFSKVESLALDPLEQLVAESATQNLRLEVEAVAERRRMQRRRTRIVAGGNEVGTEPSSISSGSDASTAASLPFPDAKNIDPYDPTTFGYLPIGTILGPHGVYGWVKVRGDTDFPHRLTEPGVRHLRPARKRAPRAVQLVTGRHCFQNEYLVLLDGCETRDDAEILRGATLYVREEDKAPVATLGNGQQEYLVSELYGLRVFVQEESSSASTLGDDVSRAMEPIGIVGGVVFGDDVSDVPLGYDMLEIALDDSSATRNQFVLIPLVPELVPVIDTLNGMVCINPPAGLLDLTYVREEKTRIKGFLPPAKS